MNLTFAAIAFTTAAFYSCGTLLQGYDDTAVYTGGSYNGTPVDVYNEGYQVGYDAGRAATYRIAYDEARRQALFLSDKMAYELGLTAQQYAAVYEINLDYIMSVGGQDDLYSTYWSRRNSDLFYVLDARQYNDYMFIDYFYRPLYWSNNYYAFRIYDRYTDHSYMYRARPSVYNTYRGGYNRTQTSHYKGQFGERKGTPPTVTNRNTGSSGGSWHGTTTPTTRHSDNNGAINTGSGRPVGSGVQPNGGSTGTSRGANPPTTVTRPSGNGTQTATQKGQFGGSRQSTKAQPQRQLGGASSATASPSQATKPIAPTRTVTPATRTATSVAQSSSSSQSSQPKFGSVKPTTTSGTKFGQVKK